MSLPLPPLELRYQIGPLDDADYDNPAGMPILDAFGVPHDVYRAVFDFGCGCGRQARQMLQQKVRPRRYLGVDIQRRVIDWCNDNLAIADPAFEFLHHDVYAPWYAAENSLRLGMSDAFPTGADGADLVAGATLKPIATTAPGEIAARHHKVLPLRVVQGSPSPPELFGALRELDAMRRTHAWRIGRALTAPVRGLRAMMGRR